MYNDSVAGSSNRDLHAGLSANEARNLIALLTNWNYIIRAPTRENRASGFLTRSDTNRPVQSQKQARSLKYHI